MSTFNREFARLLLEICRYTYATGFDDTRNAEDKQDALKRIKKVGGLLTEEPIILHGSKTSVACIASYSDRNIVAYMGTKTQFNTLDNTVASMSDWSRNIRMLLTPFKLSSEQLGNDLPQNVDKDNLGGLVHSGFLAELASVQSEVVTKLLRNGGRHKPVYITGHSQGGAEAALATRALLAGGFSVASTYTFSAPHPGNLAFAQSIPRTFPIHRIEFGNDIVPHVPPTAINEETQELIDRLQLIPILPNKIKTILDLFQQANTDNGFVSAGMLCYGDYENKTLHIDLSTAEESILLNQRLNNLFKLNHLKDWVEHHHLAGGYTALISDFA